MGDITTHVSSTDGTVYLRTQHGDSAEEIAESLRPYIGRRMMADVPNGYGYYHRQRVTLVDVNGGRVTLRVGRVGSEKVADFDAFDVFGTNCTMIEPIK